MDIIVRKDFMWWEIEAFELGNRVEKFLFTKQGHIMTKRLENPFLKNMLEIWGRNKEIFLPGISPLTPVVVMEDFPENVRHLERIFREKGDV